MLKENHGLVTLSPSSPQLCLHFRWEPRQSLARKNFPFRSTPDPLAVAALSAAITTSASLSSETEQHQQPASALRTMARAITFNDGHGDVATLQLTNVALTLVDGTHLVIAGTTPDWATNASAHEVKVMGSVAPHLANVLHTA
jgi:hypothetical protein